MAYTIRPISDRSAFTGKHRRSQFDTSWPATERLLEAEVRHLRGRNLVIEVDVTEGDLRLDGRIRANARPSTPAVRVAFESADHGPLTYATDRFTTWQDNVRAVALGLEALRKVDRYGITKRGEQYRGFRALGAGSGATASHMTREEALGVLGLWGRAGSPLGSIPAEYVDTSHESLHGLWRAARRAAHPDRHDGSRTAWDLVEAAAAVLELDPR